VYPRTATYPVTSDLASLPRWVPALPHARWPWTLAPYQGGLWHCHVPRGPGSRLPTEVSSGAATCLMASDLVSLSRWAPTLPRVPRPRTSPPCRGGARSCHVYMAPGPTSPRVKFRCCHMSHDPHRIVDRRNKERLSCPRHTANLACF
jgi:hypothetical protein